MHLIFWEFVPRPGKEQDFERAYGADGDWAKLFARSPNYRGSDLLKSTTNDTYVTVDSWDSATAFIEFKQRWHAEYAALDLRMEVLTTSERYIGELDMV